MSLPKTQYPTFVVEVPSTKVKVTCRPFLVKEEKILLMALQGNPTPDLVAQAVKQIINNCILTEPFNVDTLYLYDLEWIFLQLRINSISKKLTLKFEPRTDTDCEECRKVRVVDANLEAAKMKSDPTHTNKVDLGNNLGLVMKYPSAKLLSQIEKVATSPSIDDYFKLVWECVDYIYDTDKTYSTKDYTIEEGQAFLENLNQEQYRKLEHFFNSIPKLVLDVNVECKSCGFKENYPLVGLENFFV